MTMRIVFNAKKFYCTLKINICFVCFLFKNGQNFFSTIIEVILSFAYLSFFYHLSMTTNSHVDHTKKTLKKQWVLKMSDLITILKCSWLMLFFLSFFMKKSPNSSDDRKVIHTWSNLVAHSHRAYRTVCLQFACSIFVVRCLFLSILFHNKIMYMSYHVVCTFKPAKSNDTEYFVINHVIYARCPVICW